MARTRRYTEHLIHANHLKIIQLINLLGNFQFPASSVRRISQKVEASIMTPRRPSLNERGESKKLLLFRNGLLGNLSFYL